MTGRSRLLTAAVAVSAVATAFVAAALAVRSTGALDPLVFVGDAGPFVRWSVPLLRVASDLSAAVTVGALLLATTMIPSPAVSSRTGASRTRSSRTDTPRTGPSPTGPPPTGPMLPEDPGVQAATRLARRSALCWVMAALVGALLAFADAVGLPVTSPDLLPSLIRDFWTVDPSRVGLLSAACALVVVIGISAALPSAPDGTTKRSAGGSERGAGGAGLAPPDRMRLLGVTLVAIAGVTLVAQASHSGTSSEHETSVDALGVHLLASAVWVGGLVALLLLRSALGNGVPVVARRYSAVALWCYTALAASGVLAATTRLGSWADLLTAFGLLIVIKACILLLLGMAGWWHRTSTLARLADRPRAFVRLAVAEIFLMAVAFGVSAGLARSAPPEPETVEDPSPTLALTGFPAPPEPTWGSWLTTWRVDWLWLTIAVLAIGLYAAGLRRVRRQSASWPARRTLAWMVGWAVFIWATSGAPGVYGRVAFSWHLVQLLTVALVVPLLLALGASSPLARGVVERRDDGTIGPREVIDRVADSTLARVSSLVAAGLLAAVILVGLVDPVLELLLTTHPGHQLSIAAALVAGSLLAVRLVGVDGLTRHPGQVADPHTESRGRRLMAATAVGVYCIVLGLLLMTAGRVLGEDFYTALEVPWLTDPLADQRVGGLVAVTAGALVLSGVAVAAVLSRTPSGRT